MIGNDIVDVNITRQQINWKRKRFLDKVFTIEEQKLINNTANPFSVVWRLWSMKESAYKCYMQYNKKRFFDPKKLTCTITSNSFGYVAIDLLKLPVKTVIQENYIYSTITNSNTENHCFYIKNASRRDQQEKVYTRLKEIISKKLSVCSKKIDVRKTAVGIPKLIVNKQENNILFSLSHHGHYGAIAILNQKNE